MKASKFIIATLLIIASSFCTAILIAAPIVNTFGTEPRVTHLAITAILSVTGFVLYFDNQTRAGHLNAITVEIWVKYIMDNLFKDNSFVNMCFSADDNVLNGSVVHIPQAGAKPVVTKNRATFPAPIILRADSDVTYPLDIYRTDPTLIPNAELMEISYDKIGSVIGEHINALGDEIADDQLIKWLTSLPASRIIRTTGGATAGHAGGATGNRKKFLKEDLKKARFMMNKLGIDKKERYALIDSDMFDQLADDSDLKARDNALELDMENGIIKKLYGFALIERSTSGIFNNAGTPAVKAYGAANATTDNGAVVCWQKNAVEKALGSIKFFENKDSAENYGDIYSAEVKFGGRVRRTNAEGIVAIVQDAA